jgi:Major royal jelly protein
LRNQTAWTTRTAPANAFTPIGSRGRRGQSSTSDMAPNGVMFAAQIQLDGISCWDTRKPYNVNNVAMVQRGLGFINDLKIDSGRENIWAVSNNLPTFIYSRLDYTQTNFRLLRANIQRSISKTICDPQVPANNAELVNSCYN